ncbi:hypothetical protein FAI40_05680 [Acetobacteraceae bacterium]|nr:hypothetical protein FAI40_05680 [Acetobacteraceae bacterium]
MILFLFLLGWGAVFLLFRGNQLRPLSSKPLPKMRFWLIAGILALGGLLLFKMALQTFLLLLFCALPAALGVTLLQNLYFYFQKKKE